MKSATAPRRRTPPVRRNGLVTRAAIQRLADEIAAKFRPEQIILFGSYAYGTPHRDSDVDLLVVMPARNEIDQACKIVLALDEAFSLDLIVRTPKNLSWRLKEGDWFLKEIVGQGELLYGQTHETVGR